MKSGRKGKPRDVRVAQGNPGKRPIPPSQSSAEPNSARRGEIAPPDFLTKTEERALFMAVIAGVLNGAVARSTDVNAYGRWAAYAILWAENKRAIDGPGTEVVYETTSKHGAMLRIHPRFAALEKLERLLCHLEDRLGLNPVARQNILRGLQALPLPVQDSFFGVPQEHKPSDPSGDQPRSPIGFVSTTH